MATKEEIREWLEACGAKEGQYVAYVNDNGDRGAWCFWDIPRLAQTLAGGSEYTAPHLLNESLTGVQGPTFAEWKKAKGREGKILKIMDAYNEDSLYGHMGPAMAAKILDAIEGEGE